MNASSALGPFMGACMCLRSAAVCTRRHRFGTRQSIHTWSAECSRGLDRATCDICVGCHDCCRRVVSLSRVVAAYKTVTVSSWMCSQKPPYKYYMAVPSISKTGRDGESKMSYNVLRNRVAFCTYYSTTPQNRDSKRKGAPWIWSVCWAVSPQVRKRRRSSCSNEQNKIKKDAPRIVYSFTQ
jgi:hypothetical protein